MGLENRPLDGEDTPPLNPGLEGGAALGSRACVYMCVCVSVKESVCVCMYMYMYRFSGSAHEWVAIRVHVHAWCKTVI